MILFNRKFNMRLSAAAAVWALVENSESGQNPERYRHCMRGGYAPLVKAGHWGAYYP